MPKAQRARRAQSTTSSAASAPDMFDHSKSSRKYITSYSIRPGPLRSPPLTTVFALTSVLLFLYIIYTNPECTSSSALGAFSTATAFASSEDAQAQTLYFAEGPSMKERMTALSRWTEAEFIKKRLSIYVYDLPSKFNTDLVERSINEPGRIRDPFCDRNFYSSEVQVHRYMLSSPVRTMNPEEADFFYVPIYTTCDLITNQPNNLARVGVNFKFAMRHVIEEAPYFNRSNGRDHVYLFAQGFSARLAGDWKEYKNGIFMVHNGEFTAAEYTPHKDFTIPPDLRAYLQPFWLEDHTVTPPMPKTYLAQFGGQVLSTNISDHRGSNYSGGVRQYIQAVLLGNPAYRITGVRSDTYLEDMKKSTFCLAPEGWHPWSPRPYYSVLMGCIPVVISESQELAFEELIDWDSFVVWVRPKNIDQLDSILRSFTSDEIERRMAAMENVWKAFWYARDGLANEAILRSLHIRKYQSSPRRAFSTVK